MSDELVNPVDGTVQYRWADGVWRDLPAPMKETHVAGIRRDELSTQEWIAECLGRTE